MIPQNLYHPFEIIYKELDECSKGPHRHNFFELVYIVSGTGEQFINDNTFTYRAGHLFLMTPEDSHWFKVATTTSFFIVRFNDVYLKAQQRKRDNHSEDWIQKLEYIFHNTTHTPGCLLKNPGDKALVKALVETIIREEINKELYHKELIQQIINTFLTVVVRNIALDIPKQAKRPGSVQALNIIQYIHQHIYSPEMLRAEKMASQFGLSLNYLSEFFKKHTGESIQQYITCYKVKLVETRLLHSDLRIGEIAQELNFTDESHLNRIFKKHKGVNPTSFRKNGLVEKLHSQF